MTGWKTKVGGRARFDRVWKAWGSYWSQGVKRSQALMARYPHAVRISLWCTLLMLAIILIPTMLVERNATDTRADKNANYPSIAFQTPSVDKETAANNEVERPISFPIYLTAEKRIESVTLEQYVRGVVAAEMPIEFELEALKAQAIAARTYIIRRFVMKDISNVPVEGAWVTDSVQHQAYLTEKKIAAKWDKASRAANLAKLNQAVEETRGQIMTYDGDPILAAFFSTSNGYTENSEDYWSEELPYLRSVESPWEAEISPKFRSTVSLPIKEFAAKLRVPANKATKITSTEKTEGGRIKQVTIGGKTFTGREVREKLGLPSSQFSMKSSEGQIEITVFGNGHGVGMSQWGAQGMALGGHKAENILRHYYSGVTIERFRGADLIL